VHHPSDALEMNLTLVEALTNVLYTFDFDRAAAIVRRRAELEATPSTSARQERPSEQPPGG
jgi:hypothetical protein